MSMRSLTLAGAALLCAAPAVHAQESPAAAVAKARNGGYLGIFVRESKPGHIVIERLHPGCGAERVGLKAGDVVLSINGRAVANGDQLIGSMWGRNPYTLRVKRGDAELEFRTSTAELDNFAKVGEPAPRFALPRRDGQGHIALDELLVKQKPVVLIFGSFT